MRKDLELVRARQRSDRGARRFFERVDRVIRVHVRLALRAWPQRTMGTMQEEDLVQEIRMRLFEAVSDWDAARGSLDHYVHLFTKSRIIEIQRKESRRSRIWAETKDAIGLEVERGPEQLVIAADLERRLRECLDTKLESDTAKRMLSLLYDLKLGPEELQVEGVSSPHADQWRFRIRKAARECLAEFEAEGPSAENSENPDKPDATGGVNTSRRIEP